MTIDNNGFHFLFSTPQVEVAVAEVEFELLL